MPRSLGAAVATLGLALSATAPVHAAPMADLDRDGVFDDLESRIRNASPKRDMQVIIRLERDATRDRAADLERRIDSLDVKRRFRVVDAVAGVLDARQVRALAAAPGVSHVERVARVHAMNTGAQRWFGVTAARLDPDVPGLDGDGDGNAATYSAGDMVAAVIDTGIHATHSSLDGGKVIAFQDFTDGDSGDTDTPFDDEGHGTHVAATIAGDAGSGSARGVAPGAALVGLKVLDEKGEGSSLDVIRALDWIAANGVAHGIEVVNLSLGGTGCSDGQDAESDAVNALVAAGYVVAVAAGNDGPAGCTGDTGISTPAAAADVITVAAMADVDASGFFLADFSSRGPTLDGRTKPDIAAPGVAITSASNQDGLLATASGTSMATPFVAGVALLMRDLNPALTPGVIKQTLMDTAIDWGKPGDDSDHGAGRLDAYGALALAAVPGQLDTPPADLPQYRHVQASLAAGGADRFFTLSPQAGTPLAVGLTVADESTDFDMFLYNASGKRVAAANSPHRQDELHLATASAGPYTLRVESWEGSGTFYLDVSGAATVIETGDVPAPVNVESPSIAGSSEVGSALTGSQGSWTGTPAITYEWERCTSAGTSCTATGDIDLSYVVTTADAGRGIRLAVTAENPGGSTVAYSPVRAIPGIAPTPQTQPTLIGDAREGTPLSVTTGSWTGTAPIAYSYEWSRCDAAGAGCAAIAGATDASYIAQAADVGRVLRATVTASNSAGAASASAQTGLVASASGTQSLASPQPPVNEVGPTVSGPARHGQRLRAGDGIWRGVSPIAFVHQWLRCNSIGFDCVAIPGASESTYRLREGDLSRRIAVRVLASNADGSAQADSEASNVVVAARPVARRKPSIAGRAARGGILRARGGTWWGTPRISFSATWLRCSRAGRRCKPVGRRAAYVPGRGDVGHRLRLRVTAANSGGRRTSTSAASAIVRSLPQRRPALRNANRLTVRVASEPDAGATRRRVRLAPR